MVSGINSASNAGKKGHNLHEITMYYPMRVQRNKLIENLDYKMPYPIAIDIYSSSTF